MQTDIDKLEIYLSHLTKDQHALLKKYYETLLHFNSKVNLVSASTATHAAKQHFADSVLGIELCLKHMPFDKEVYDFGSGNGFPGIVLGVMRPDLKVALVERDMRKAEFLKHMSAELGLSNIRVYANSIESLPKNSVSLGITRALGAIGPLSIQMTSLFSTGGALFHFKGESWSSELANCPTQIFTKWDIQSIGQYTLPDSTIERTIMVGKKL